MTDKQNPNYLTMILGLLVLVFATLYFSRDEPRQNDSELRMVQPVQEQNFREPPRTTQPVQEQNFYPPPTPKKYTMQERDNFMAMWRHSIIAMHENGTWFSWVEGGGFRDVDVMVTNYNDFKIDEVWVRFKVEKRSNNKICFNEVFKFKNIGRGETKSAQASAPCGMRPAEIQIIYLKCSRFDYEYNLD